MLKFVSLLTLLVAGVATSQAQFTNLQLLGSNATINLRETTPRGVTSVTGFEASNNTTLGRDNAISATGLGDSWSQSGRARQQVTGGSSGFEATSSVRLDQTYVRGKNASNGIASARGSLEFTLTKVGDYGLTLRANQAQTGVPAGGLFPALDSYATLFRTDDPNGTPILQFDLSEAGNLTKSGTARLQPGTYSVLFGSAVSRTWTDLTSPDRKTPYFGQIDSTLSLNAVPAPSALTVFGLGGVVFLRRRR
ncbi:hypothetical protein BH11ARM2_BH11ARM2_35920 [soil metagenome]